MKERGESLNVIKLSEETGVSSLNDNIILGKFTFFIDKYRKKR